MPLNQQLFSHIAQVLNDSSTGTEHIVIVTMLVPPKLGFAIGTRISEPRPVEVSSRSSAEIVMASLLRAGTHGAGGTLEQDRPACSRRSVG